MATTYHPQVYRGSSSPAAAAPSLSSSAREHAAPHSPSTPRRTATTTTTSTSTAPPAARSSHARQRSSTYSRLRQAKPECTLPAYGLSTDPSQFPLHPSSTPDVPFRTITADQFAEMNHAHADLKVNESVLFPWMHGSDFPNTQQAANFGYTNGNRQRVPRFRGLTTLFARSEARQRDSNDSQVQPPHSRNPTSASLASSCSTDSFVSSSSYATTQSASCSSFSSSSGSESPGADPDSRASSIFGSSGSLSTTPSSLGSSPPSKHGHEQGPEECSCLLTNIWFPEEVFHPTAPNSFYPPLLPAGISFRHFRMQSAKYTSISDIVIYSENGGYTAEAVELAKRARLAMIDCEKDRLERGDDQCLSYEVYVVTDPFYVFEQRYPYLVAIDSSHFARNQVNFVEKEHEEMRDFTQATEIADNVWLGNSFDAPPLDLEGEYEAHGRRTSADSATSTFASNPLAFAICVEAGDQATMSTQRELRSKERYMDDLQDQRLLEAHYAEVERKNKAAVAKRSTFWFSSSSGSSSEDDSDFDDFGEDDSSSDKENAASFAGTGSAEDAALSLSLAQQGSLDATPVKLQYKKQSKSLRHARDAKVASILGVSPSALPMARTSTPAVPTSRPVLQASPAEIVRLQAISSAQNATSVLQQTAVVDSILELVVWLRAQARPHLRTSMEQRGARGQVNNLATTLGTSPRRVLIHCADGYTDSSLLALAYIMYDRVCSLPDAYLYLQNEKKRSFFVYPADVAVLGALEQKINYVARCQNRVRFNDDLSREQIQAVLEQERQQIKEKEKERLAVQAKQQQQQQQQQAPSPMGALSLSATARSYLPSRPSLFGRQGSANSVASSSTIRGPSPASSTSSATSRSASPSAVPQGLSNASTHPWFYSEKYDGHFPSRILDFLYLGNLNHATNPLMLKQLGITHVLSIGESALVPPAKQAPAPGSTSSAAKARTPTNSLWVEQSLGNMTVCDIQDIQDDGCDVILPHLVTAMEFIHAAHKAGGKVLVHCRVGVSRSATLVIAYVMKHLDLSLVDAYLMVRARRLNILIQPTILFMWTLHMWEEEIRESGVDDEGVVIRERAGRISWPVLATEIANLNNKYLGC